MTMRHADDRERDTGEAREGGPAEPGSEDGPAESGRAMLPGMPETEDASPLGDTDQHSTA
jgi:hypothetical protein